MPRPTDGLSQRPAAALTSLECFGVGKAIARVAGSAFIQRPAVPKITLGGFDAPSIRVHIEGLVR
jgi:hypothetical protein